MKNRGRGVQLLLTRNPKKDFYPEGASRPRDLSSHPMMETFQTLSERVSVPSDKRCCESRPGRDHREPTEGSDLVGRDVSVA